MIPACFQRASALAPSQPWLERSGANLLLCLEGYTDRPTVARKVLEPGNRTARFELPDDFYLAGERVDVCWKR